MAGAEQGEESRSLKGGQGEEGKEQWLCGAFESMGEAGEIRIQDRREKILGWRDGLADERWAVLQRTLIPCPAPTWLAVQPCVTLALRDLVLSGLHGCCTCVVERQAQMQVKHPHP